MFRGGGAGWDLLIVARSAPAAAPPATWPLQFLRTELFQADHFHCCSHRGRCFLEPAHVDWDRRMRGRAPRQGEDIDDGELDVPVRVVRRVERVAEEPDLYR